MVVVLSCACATCADEKDKDPVKEKLFAAKVAYDKEMAAFRKAVDDWFDRREEIARKDGNKKLVDQVKVERKAFDDAGELPRGAPVAMQQKHDRARKALEAAYAEAVKAYTRAKKDDLAAATDKELESFRNSAKDSWVAKFLPGTYSQSYDDGTKSTFELRKDGTFTRVRDGLKAAGDVSFADGKLIMKCEHFVEVWSVVGGEVKIDYWSPPGNYPNAKVSARGLAIRSKQ
jgi:hypothetical protein